MSSAHCLGRAQGWQIGKRAILILMGCTLASAGLGADRARASQSPAASVVFDSVIVIDVEQGRLLPAQRVVLAGNRIRSVGPVRAVEMPKGAQRVDARGKYLIPGLWDLHIHPGGMTPLFNLLFIAHGVTGLRAPSLGVSLDTAIQWRREILGGVRVGPPRQLFAGLSLDGPRKGCQRKDKRMTNVCVADSADARNLVDSLHAAGSDFIKTYNLSKEMYFVIAAEARRLGIPFGGHVNYSEGLTALQASDSGARIMDHKDASGDLNKLCWGQTGTFDQCRLLAERFVRNNTWWVPTLSIFALGGGDPALLRTRPIAARVRKLSREFWSGSLLQGNWLRDQGASASSDSDSVGLMRLVQRAGMPILSGTDVSSIPAVWRGMAPGFSLHAELAMLVAEGLTPLNALQSATLNPAKMLRGTDSLGTVAPGKLADLVLLDANPLADITNTTTVRGVVANGRYFDRAALDHLLTDTQRIILAAVGTRENLLYEDMLQLMAEVQAKVRAKP